ncbi:MAG: hypothetical protein FWE80_07150 [Oscillospiraceae bacterium]|nr:hypothetical protein [Oscillospiraceae bacterium]
MIRFLSLALVFLFCLCACAAPGQSEYWTDGDPLILPTPDGAPLKRLPDIGGMAVDEIKNGGVYDYHETADGYLLENYETEGRVLSAYDAGDKLLWSMPVPEDSQITPHPDGRILLSAPGELRLLDTDGAELWRQTVSNLHYFSQFIPQSGGGFLIAGCVFSGPPDEFGVQDDGESAVWTLTPGSFFGEPVMLGRFVRWDMRLEPVAGGWIWAGSDFITGLSADFSAVWAYTLPADSYVNDWFVTAAGETVFSLQQVHPDDQPMRRPHRTGYLRKLDAAGELVFDRAFDYLPFKLAELPGGGIVAYTQTMEEFADWEYGTLRWYTAAGVETASAFLPYRLSYYNMKVLDNGNVVVWGTRALTGNPGDRMKAMLSSSAPIGQPPKPTETLCERYNPQGTLEARRTWSDRNEAHIWPDGRVVVTR